MLRQRIITASILVLISILGFFGLDGLPFALFIGFVITLGAWEWARLAGLSSQADRMGYALVVALLLVALHWLSLLAIPLLLLSAAWWLLAIMLILKYPDSSRFWVGKPRTLFIGLLILLPAWQGLVLLKSWPQGNWLILAVMLLVWVADIGAFFVGRKLGRHKLAPKVSPGKSWEGFWGGLVSSLAVTLFTVLYQGWSIQVLIAAMIVSTIVVAISVVGDLTESMFKRSAGVKDSSQLLPGHGGILDRIDSLTAAIPVFAVLLWLAGWGN
ncbi:phosphatidate cytidylyltransferase [Azomonas macrocytogenes]|uniref:Phosphatidate cytidylyltransferase n=1 Tax=Azomonas macrocytogenes TaxID=69962 RepID=A0A839T2E6_AZOMA|nr:phosphatidate cytidylyltransferase [Azomonas macrocytogenes]MBB3103711.1 phosphatidate cytidylyltransferase [Azomonas macrocytogenes]